MRLSKFHIVFVILLGLAACGKKTDWRFTLDKNSTEPFGVYLAYDNLKEIYPSAEISTIYDLPEYIADEKESYLKNNTLLISVTDGLYLSIDEAEDLYEYVENGGTIIALSDYFSKPIDSLFNIENTRLPMVFPLKKKDSLSEYDILWNDTFHAFRLDMPFDLDYFSDDSAWGFRVVEDEYKANLVIRNIGKGQILFGNSPEMFTNYAMLKDDNKAYYEKLLSSYSSKTSYVKWFSAKKVMPKPKRSKGGLWSLLNKKEYRSAFFVLLLMGLLLLIFETKRRQRIVPVVMPVTNDSLAFTEAIGKLYYGEKDNANLTRKMIRYYLEHIRTTYNMPTKELDADFANKLAKKINQPADKVVQFVNYLNLAQQSAQRSEQEIKTLYKLLKKYN